MDMKSDAVVNPLKLGKDKREYRWFVRGSDCVPETGERKKYSADDLEKMIQVRTSIFHIVF